MIRTFIVMITLLSLSACEDAAPTASVEMSPGGIPFRLVHMPEREDVAIHIAWATDWAYRKSTNKAAPVVGTQLILAGGASGYPAGDVSERFADLKSGADVFVAAHDHVVGELVFNRDHLDETIAIANAHLRAPTLDQIWFDRLREGTAARLAEVRGLPAHAGFEAVRWAVFGHQPLRNAMSMDKPGTVHDLTRADVVAWHAETFTRKPQAIVVAGGISVEEAGVAIDTLLNGLPDKVSTNSRLSSTDYSARRILLHQPEAEVTTLALIAPLPSTRKEGEFQDIILLQALGGDDQSVLFNAVRTKLRASYGFEAGVTNYTREHRIMFLTGQVESDKVTHVERVVREAYAGFRQTGSLGDLNTRIKSLEANSKELAQSVTAQARSELQSALDGFEVGRSLRIVEKLSVITEDSLRERLLKEFPNQEDFIVIAISPDPEALAQSCIIRSPAEAVDCK